MAEDRESIRRQAEEVRAEKELRKQWDARSSAFNAEAQEGLRQREIELARVMGEKAEEILEVCSRFAVWGTENDIPYNSPSIFARGWVLGSRNGGPEAYSMGFSNNTLYSRYSLLVKKDESVRELLLHNAAAKQRGQYFPWSMLRFTDLELLALPRSPQPEAYSIKSIEESIAQFSGEYGAEW